MKALKFLLNHKAAMSEREIASVLDVSHMSINRIMKELSNINFVNYLTVGKAHLWKVNRKSYSFSVLSKLLTDISQIDSPLNDLKKTIRENLPGSLVKKVVLFGSLANGSERENSDIDVFILVKNREMKSRIEPYIENLSNKCVDLYGNRFAPYILTGYEEKQKKDLDIIAEINKGIQIIPVQE